MQFFRGNGVLYFEKTLFTFCTCFMVQLLFKMKDNFVMYALNFTSNVYKPIYTI